MAGGEHGGGTAQDEAVHLQTIAQALGVFETLRRRWIVVLASTLVGVCVAASIVVVLRPRWQASASLVLHASGPRVLDKVEGVGEDADARHSGYREFYETQRAILRSRAVAERALAELGLRADPTFLGVDDIRSEPERAARIAEIDPVDRLRELIQVDPVENSRVVRVTATYPDPEVAAEIANAAADAYLEHVRTGRSRAGVEAKDNLQTERAKAHEALRTTEAALAEFKQSHGITSISLDERQNVTTENTITLSRRAKEAEAERIALEATYVQAERLHAAGNLAGATLLPEHERTLLEELRREQAEAERELRRLEVVMGPKHPELRKAEARLQVVTTRLVNESRDLLASLEARYKAAQATERGLKQSLRGEQADALALGQLEREYRELERESKTAADAYGVVSQRDTEIGMTNRVESEGIEILDRAHVPSQPVYPPKLLLGVLGLLGGLGFGIALALAVDHRDHRLRGLVDLERSLSPYGLPVLGQLPLLQPDTRLGVGNVRAQRRQRDLYAHLFPQSLMAERCRGIRTSLGFVQGAERLKTLMVTSPNSTEGKSSTAMNLALSFCQTGKRVLLVDADMRRPRLHQVFSRPSGGPAPALGAVLEGKAALDAAIVGPGEGLPENLSILACEEIPERPAELLGTPACRELLRELGERFDMVVIDSPPVLPVTDPSILAPQVDGVVLVARCEATTRSDLQQAIAQLRKGDTHLLGVVLNEVDTRRDRYGYDLEYYAYRTPRTEAERA